MLINEFSDVENREVIHTDLPDTQKIRSFIVNNSTNFIKSIVIQI